MSIQLAKTGLRNSNKNREVEKCCKECGKKYTGHSITKYCEYHRNPKNRKKNIIPKKDVKDDNQIINHKFKESVQTEFTCKFEGCEEKIQIKLIPKIFIYPKYCEKHRTPYKRELYKKRKAGGK